MPVHLYCLYCETNLLFFSLGFAWCESTQACYSVAEPSHCPSTKTRALPGRVLEVTDCPWCVHDTEETSGASNPKHPLFQGLLVHYMNESETNNLSKLAPSFFFFLAIPVQYQCSDQCSTSPVPVQNPRGSKKLILLFSSSCLLFLLLQCG